MIYVSFRIQSGVTMFSRGLYNIAYSYMFWDSFKQDFYIIAYAYIV